MSLIDIKFTKFDNTPWGFRLAGGSDFPQPLTVIKVTEGGLAECMGLKTGDVVTRLNDRPVSSLTHGQAHEALMLAGNNFVLGVLRPTDSLQTIEGIQDDNIVPYTIPLDQLPPVYPEEILTVPIDELGIEEQVIPEVEEQEEEPTPEKPVDANSEVVPNKNLTDEEIAQLILEEEELLIPDQGVLGVNFNKIRPRVEKLKQSKVLEELQKIAVEEPPRVQELKHKSTFLQKPEGPAPPSKSDLEKQARGEGEQYRVVIKKQQKKSVTERLLERGLLEPREEQKLPEEAPTEVNTLCTTVERSLTDRRAIATIVPKEIGILQVVPRIREIKVNVVQDSANRDCVSSPTPADRSPPISGPNMRDLLNLLDSVQSLEALLLRKCAEQDETPIETIDESPPIPENRQSQENSESDGNDDDKSAINYTPWCNAFKSELQLVVPSDDVFAEFTVKIGSQEDNRFSQSNDVNCGDREMNEDRESRGVKSIAMPNVRRLRKRLRRDRYLKSCLAMKKIPRRDTGSLVTSRGRVKLCRRGRYLENYLTRKIGKIASWCGSLGRFVGGKRAKAKGSRHEFSRRNRYRVARGAETKIGIVDAGGNDDFGSVSEGGRATDFGSASEGRRAADFGSVSEGRRATDFRKPRRKTIARGRYAEKISRSVYSYAKALVSREKSKIGCPSRSNVFLEALSDLARSTGCFVTDRIFRRGQKTRLSRKWRRVIITDLSAKNRDFAFRGSECSLNSQSTAISQETTDNGFDDEDEYDASGIGGVDDGDFYENREDFEICGKRRSSIVTEIVNSCGGSFAKLAACALVPFTSIILLYLYK